MMPKPRKIIHIDMDCFYASIEVRDNPSLQGKPVAVGGSAQKRGVLSTCNYEARKFGLHSAMPTAKAIKKCPNLILLPVNMSLYKAVSQQIYHIFQRYTDQIEPLSLDEAYLDVTDCEKCQGSATWIAQEIRQAIFEELHLTASAGVAPLKFLAKIASDQNKPNGQFVIKPEQVDAFIFQLPLKKIPGVGKVTTQLLAQLGLHTCADIQQVERNLLLQHFGKMGQRIWDFSHGIDERGVQNNRIRKSVGVEKTLLQNIVEEQQAVEIVKRLYPILVQRFVASCPTIPLSQVRRIGVKLKFEDFQITTLDKSEVKCDVVTFIRLLAQIWQRAKGRSVRLIGLHLYLPSSQQSQQLDLW